MSDSLDKVVESSARGGFALVSGSVVASLILAAGLVIVPRMLGPDDYGIYALSFIFSSLLILVSDFGANAGLTRFSASFHAKGKDRCVADIAKYGLTFKIIISVVAFIISFIFADYFATVFLNRPDMGLYVRLLSLILPFQITFDAINSAFIGLDYMSRAAVLQILQAIGKVATSIFLVVLGFGVFGAIMGQVIGCLIAGLAGPILFWFNPYRRLYKCDGNSYGPTGAIKMLVVFGFPLYISALLGGFIPQYQGIILAQFTSDFQIGNLKAATNLLTLLTMITLPISSTLFPAFSKLNPNGEEIKRFFDVAVKYTTLLVIPATFLVILFADDIVLLAYGSSYTLAPLFVSIFCITYFTTGLGSLVQGAFFNGTGNTWMTFKMTLLSLVVVVPLIPLLTLFYGVPGLIMAQISAGLCSTLYGLRVVRSRFSVRFSAKSLLKIYLVSAITALPVAAWLSISNLWWVWQMILGTAVYVIIWATLVPLTRTISSSELGNIRNLVEKHHTLRKVMIPIVRYEEILATEITKTKP